jgi:hypothetical protein
MTATPIAPGSWLHEDRFATFRAAYAYASARTQAIPGLSKLTPEDAWYVWHFLQRGHLRMDRTAEDRGRAAFEALVDDLWSMPTMSGMAWHELPDEARVLWMAAADAVAAVSAAGVSDEGADVQA